ncbi:hypothetical protein B0H15DRAFT_929434 [Mycena belliarum]|uniref:Uncharacterized protein n=1 Tax=Mycena belliarum TaxID=1033014 RepID=A0AAD6U7F9_9AGAR|nr:hypothetical protein B0H15DRAFT_929434 [Mycena belliae]
MSRCLSAPDSALLSLYKPALSVVHSPAQRTHPSSPHIPPLSPRRRRSTRHPTHPSTGQLAPTMLAPPASASAPAAAPRPADAAKGRRPAAAPFFMPEDDAADAFYRKRGADPETGCLVPPDADADAAVPDLTSLQTGGGGGVYAAYRRWFARGARGVRLPEKGEEEPPARGTPLERRVQAGSWTAMVLLLILTAYFLMRETSSLT